MGLPGVYSLDEIARAAGVTEAQARALASADTWFSGADAVRLGRALVERRRAATTTIGPALFLHQSQPWLLDSPGVPMVVSGALHVALLAALVFALGAHATTATNITHETQSPSRLVFVVSRGPGGGGGGGGSLQRTSPSKALLKGRNAIASPLPPPPPSPALEELRAEPIAPASIVAPIATAPNDDRDRKGVLTQVTTTPDESLGAGRGGGAGTGAGTGVGEGSGSGVGPGIGGGFGGGAYRPGSGITPPRVLREVKGDYTEDARRRGVTGDVVMEVVVLRDGSVGNVRVLQGLGLGLDERATAAVRQWRFSPAERQGVPVDVVVEVGMEFKLR